MGRKKLLWIIIGAVVLIGGGGYVAYRLWFSPSSGEEATATLETAAVTFGDLSVTASGAGVLVPSQEARLAFSVFDVVIEVLVEVGDAVEAGAILASVDDAAARQAFADAELAVIQAEQALAVAGAQADLDVARAEADLASAQDNLDALLDWAPDDGALEIARANLYSAQIAYRNAASRAGMTDAQNASARISLDQAVEVLASAQEAYEEAMSPARDWERDIEATRENAAASLVRAQQNLEIAQANYDLAMIDSSQGDVQSAYAKLVEAQRLVEDLESAPDEDEITVAELAVQAAKLALQRARLAAGSSDSPAVRQAELALEKARLQLAEAQKTLDGTTLVAPFAGTVTEVSIEVGETASTPAIVLADLRNPLIQFWIEESDMANVAVDKPVNVVFESLPDYTYPGEIIRVEPVLVEISGTTAVQCWATIDATAHPVTLLGNMNADVEVVAGEATDALLVPVQALRSMGNDRYAVFVVMPNGELEYRPVEIGLQDFVNAVILSGLEPGEVVSLGESTSSGTTTGTSANTGQLSAPGGFLPGNMRP